MPDTPETEPKRRKRRPAIGRAAFVLVMAALFGVYRLLVMPDTPLPRAWNPLEPLVVADPVTPLTDWKLRRAMSQPQACLDVLLTGATARPLPDLRDGPHCGIVDQVRLSAISGARIDPLNTRCQTALRMAMWVTHGVIPAAESQLGQGINEVTHFSSYSCRPIRTLRGPSARMSTHAAAEAVDISGFVLADGTRVSLLDNWDEEGPKAAFLRQARDSACAWFGLTLGPDYNLLHADHFHLQHRGSGLCR